MNLPDLLGDTAAIAGLAKVVPDIASLFGGSSDSEQTRTLPAQAPPTGK